MAQQNKVLPCLLVVPYPVRYPPNPILTSPKTPNKELPLFFENQDKERERSHRRRKLFCVPLSSCNCLCAILSALGLTALLGLAIGIPFIISVITSKDSTTAAQSTVLLTLSTTVQTTTTTTTDIPCSPACNSQQTCVSGVCVGIGYLSITLKWSRLGDGDLVVTTPNNKTISYTNTGPSILTDQGSLDVDDKNGTGPENIFWSNSSFAPPNGLYYVCFEPYSFIPSATILTPVSIVISIGRSTNSPIIFTKNITSAVKNNNICDVTAPTLVGTFSYP